MEKDSDLTYCVETWNNILKVLNESDFEPRIICIAKLTLKNMRAN